MLTTWSVRDGWVLGTTSWVILLGQLPLSHGRAYLPDGLNSSCTGSLSFLNTPFQWLHSTNGWNLFSFFLKLKSLCKLCPLISALALGIPDKSLSTAICASGIFIKLSRSFFSRLIHTSPLNSSRVLGITRFSLGNVEIKNSALQNFLFLWNKKSPTDQFTIQSHRFDFWFSDCTNQFPNSHPKRESTNSM